MPSLEGEQSPWKERALQCWQRCWDATDPSTEQGLEVGRSTRRTLAARSGNGPCGRCHIVGRVPRRDPPSRSVRRSRRPAQRALQAAPRPRSRRAGARGRRSGGPPRWTGASSRGAQTDSVPRRSRQGSPDSASAEAGSPLARLLFGGARPAARRPRSVRESSGNGRKATATVNASDRGDVVRLWTGELFEGCEPASRGTVSVVRCLFREASGARRRETRRTPDRQRGAIDPQSLRGENRRGGEKPRGRNESRNGWCRRPEGGFGLREWTRRWYVGGGAESGRTPGEAGARVPPGSRSRRAREGFPAVCERIEGEVKITEADAPGSLLPGRRCSRRSSRAPAGDGRRSRRARGRPTIRSRAHREVQARHSSFDVVCLADLEDQPTPRMLPTTTSVGAESRTVNPL